MCAHLGTKIYQIYFIHYLLKQKLINNTFTFLLCFISATPGAQKMNVSVKDLTVCYDSHQSSKPCSHK